MGLLVICILLPSFLCPFLRHEEQLRAAYKDAASVSSTENKCRTREILILHVFSEMCSAFVFPNNKLRTQETVTLEVRCRSVPVPKAQAQPKGKGRGNKGKGAKGASPQTAGKGESPAKETAKGGSRRRK